VDVRGYDPCGVCVTLVEVVFYLVLMFTPNLRALFLLLLQSASRG